MGGKEEVLLTAKEHFICHLLLCKMLIGTEKHKMINALIKMAFAKSKGQERYTSRSFTLVRSLIAEKNSELFKGKSASKETKEKMKKNNGRYIRTPEIKKKISEIQRNRFKNSPGTFTGKKFTEEMTIKRNKTRKERNIKPKFTAKGCRHYTNGKINKLCFPGSEPDGFWLGRTIKKRNVKNA